MPRRMIRRTLRGSGRRRSYGRRRRGLGIFSLIRIIRRLLR